MISQPPPMGTRPPVFPCESCGADLTFGIGVQSLQCAHCGHVKTITFDADAAIDEQDFHAMLERLAQLRASADRPAVELNEVQCGDCGAAVTFTGTLTSTLCAYCGAPLQLDQVHRAPDRLGIDGVLPFRVDDRAAREHLNAWVRSRWFAPGDFQRGGIAEAFHGVYLPFWTYDTLTTTHYRGQRGEHYYVTVGSGKNRRTERRTRWYPASGHFQRFFDDVLVAAGGGLPEPRLAALEPWPLQQCHPFAPQLLAGFQARTYDVDLEAGFAKARVLIDAAIADECRQRIGGDTQRLESVQSRYEAVTYKHLLLPVWMLAYRYRDKTYQVVVNATTGEVQGDRPYSWLKITLAALLAAALAGIIALIASQG